jgi:hypothetical protein
MRMRDLMLVPQVEGRTSHGEQQELLALGAPNLAE